MCCYRRRRCFLRKNGCAGVQYSSYVLSVWSVGRVIWRGRCGEHTSRLRLCAKMDGGLAAQDSRCLQARGPTYTAALLSWNSPVAGSLKFSLGLMSPPKRILFGVLFFRGVSDRSTVVTPLHCCHAVVGGRTISLFAQKGKCRRSAAVRCHVNKHKPAPGKISQV